MFPEILIVVLAIVLPALLLWAFLRFWIAAVKGQSKPIQKGSPEESRWENLERWSQRDGFHLDPKDNWEAFTLPRETLVRVRQKTFMVSLPAKRGEKGSIWEYGEPLK